MEMRVCQSCGYPLKKEEDKGTNADGTRNEEYCCYCYKDGKFTNPDMDVEGMIEHVTKIAVEKMNISEEKARNIAREVIPRLKRWKK